MDINRNQCFLVGLVLLFLGVQFLMVESFVFTPEFTQFLAKQTDHPLASVNAAAPALIEAAEPVIKKTVHPPEWLGWALLSLSGTLILQSLVMKKPD